jgi:hypothetical protein
MTTEKVIVIVAVMMFLEYLYIKQNAASLVANAVQSSTQGALGVVGAAAVIDVGSAIMGIL